MNNSCNHEPATSPVFLDNPQFLLISNNRYSFYLIDLKTTPNIDLIIDACAGLEAECWGAQQDFKAYLSGRDLLIYATHKGELAAFCVGSAWRMQDYGVISPDEMMVSPSHRRRYLGRTMTALLGRVACLGLQRDPNIKRIVGICTTPSPGLIMGIHKYRFMSRDHSFKPSPKLIEIRDHHLRRNRWQVLNQQFPFFIKGLFPGSLKTHQTAPQHKIFPPDFDCAKRGDALLFMGSMSTSMVMTVTALFLQIDIGHKAWRNPRLGLASRFSLENYETSLSN